MTYGMVYRAAFCDHCNEKKDVVVGCSPWSDECSCAGCLSGLIENINHWSSQWGIKMVATEAVPSGTALIIGTPTPDEAKRRALAGEPAIKPEEVVLLKLEAEEP